LSSVFERQGDFSESAGFERARRDWDIAPYLFEVFPPEELILFILLVLFHFLLFRF